MLLSMPCSLLFQHKKKLIKSKTQSGSDTSDNDEDKHRDSSASNITFSLPHKRKDSGNSSDNDGPPNSGGVGGVQASLGIGSFGHSTNVSSNGATGTSSSPCAKKKYGGSSRSCIGHKDVVDSTNHVGAKSVADTAKCTNGQLSDSCSGQKSNCNGNNKDCDSSSLRVLANKFVDSSLARISNFSLASQTSSISSRSSTKYSANTTPRSSQRRSKDGNKFSKAKFMHHLRMDFSDLSDRELTDSDCSSLHNSLRLKISTATTASGKEYSVIAEEQASPVNPNTAVKKSTECCSVM